jgi:sugar O-acyltransferase (sialic acid O-acetyltransferase NeuD family)
MTGGAARGRLLVYGAGGHAKVVIDIIERAGQYDIAGLLDDDQALHGQEVFGYRVLGALEQLDGDRNQGCHLIVALGSNELRLHVSDLVGKAGYGFATAVHPSAQIARGVSIGPGTVVMAGAVINSDSILGQHVVVNTGASVDHDCSLGDFSQVAPGAHLAGNVTLDTMAYVGIGASVIPGVRIGAGAMIGAGAAVVRDIPEGVTAVGVPARVVRRPAGKRSP